MSFKVIFVSSLLCISVRVQEIEERVSFYRKIWDENLAELENAQLPVNNEKFKTYSRDQCEEIQNIYDFVIVGGGSSGSVLAARLSEVSSWNILLLETGGDESDFSKIPGAFDALPLTKLNWGYLTVPQKNACFGYADHRCAYTRGKVLGGGSSVNAMMHVRGNKLDFDNWEQLGNAGWSHKDVLPYFRKSEKALFKGDNGYHGYNGPLQITRLHPLPPYSQILLDANEELGYEEVDYNGKRQFGYGDIQANVNCYGSRHSTNQGYLQPARKRGNLKILTEALVTKVLLTNLTATGVEYLHKGTCFTVKPKKETILSAGSINTPQILMLSGIGPEEHLVSLGIKPLVNLPVGQHLFEHPTLQTITFPSNVTYAKPNLNESLSDYAAGRGGWLTYIPSHQISYLKISNETCVPDVELMYTTSSGFIPGTITNRALNYNNELDQHFASMNFNDLAMHIMLLHPKSFGSVTLNSTDPTDFPLIDPKYLENPDDLNTLLAAVKEVLKLLETSAFKKANVTNARIPIEECNELQGDDYWKCVIKYKVSGMYHPVGTCRMGTDRNDSVVDRNLKVHGIRNLRVVDAGVIPRTTSGHLNSVAVMIAEKISDQIKRNYIPLHTLIYYELY